MKLRETVILVSVCVLILCWNLVEIFSIQPGRGAAALGVPESIDLPSLNWDWFNQVEVTVVEGVCREVKIPPDLERLDGEMVVVSGPSFACGDDLVEHAEGYTIKGFVMVPYFGMIDCCVGNPIPYYQWTIIVKELASPWEIHHKGVIDPSVVVRSVYCCV